MVLVLFKTTILFSANNIAIYGTWTLMAYLTIVWNLNLTYAAATVNLFKGSIQLMPMAMQFLIDTYTGHFFMLLLTTISYCIGLGLLTLSTPPVTGICSQYKPECVGEEQMSLFFTGLAFIAVGMAGFNVSAQKFHTIQVDAVAEQLRDTSNYELDCWYGSGCILTYVIPCILIVVISYVKPWLFQFGLPAVFTLIATILFASGMSEYDGREVSEHGSPLTDNFRVLVASTFKMFKECPTNPNELYQGNTFRTERLRHTPHLRFFDKAAIILPTTSLTDQERKKWRLCSITEVEETKRMIHIIPTFLCFIICGVVSSVGDTYFQEQATTLNTKIWGFLFPLNFLKLIYDSWKGKEGPTDEDKFPGYRGVGFARFSVAMVVSIICCSTAAIVEFYRQWVVKKNGLIDKPDEVVPMSILWMIPQFVLLGYLDRNTERGSYQLMTDIIGPSMKKDYLEHVVSAVSGIGIIGSALCVFVVDMITKRGGKTGWFQDSLNKSQLDYYYWLLAFLSAVNFGFFLLMSQMCKCWEAQLEEIRNQREEHDSDTILEPPQLIETSRSVSDDQIQPFLG